MEHPSARRPPDTDEEQLECYKKDKGAAGIHGHVLEYKFSALLYLTAKNKGQKFKLASNVEGFRPFDDVVVEYHDENYRKSHIFVQLKSKTKQHIKMQQLLADKGDFSLRAYYDSYIQIEEKFNCGELGLNMDGSVDESLFIIYTNADVPRNLKSNKDTDIGEEKFLMTGGSVVLFNEEEHKTVYEHLQDLPNHRKFLSRFRIFYKQADETQMDLYIKSELQKSMRLHGSELDVAYICFLEFMKEWWQHENFVLKNTNSRKYDPLLKTSEKVRPTFIAKLLEQRKSEINELNIKFKQSAITDMEQLIESHKAVLIFAPGSSTTLTAAKIHQMLSATKHVILNLHQLTFYMTEVMLAWEIMFDMLVLEIGGSAGVSPDLFNELSGFLNRSVEEKKFIVISKSISNIEQTDELPRAFHTNLPREYDDWKFTDIVPESRMHFLNRTVDFQGAEIELSKLLRTDDVGLLNTLDCDSISLLLENVKPSIGVSTVDTVKYYIDRTLQSRKHDNTRLPTQGEMQRASIVDRLLDIQDSFQFLEEKVSGETVTCWKPATLLESDGRIILVTDEPGMGKSTLLKNLAKNTRNTHPDMWIVMVSVNNHTRILNKLKTNGCNEKGVINLLTEAAQIKETGGVLLERRLFDYTYNSTGNMAVLIDGVDEVSPLYTEEVIQVLKILSKTKIKRIWISSRNSLKDRLETEFQCQSYLLTPFSEKDQKRFLVKFWKETCPEIEDDYIDDLADRIVKLSTEQLTAEEKKFMGIPLQSFLLAEMFEEYLKEYSTSSTVELPEHINIVMLYDLYVEKKWDIYVEDKKRSDQTNVMVRNDEAELQKSFMHNHKAAALLAIFSKHQVEKLADKTIAQRARDFIQNIADGIEKTGIIIEVIEGQPIFQHRTLAEYLVARWLCDSFQNGQILMMDHLLEPGFRVVRSMLDRILADKCTLHEAVLNSNLAHIEKLLQMKEFMTQNDRGGRTPLHVAVSSCSPNLIQLLLEHEADVNSADTLLGLSPVEYAMRMADWEVLGLMMEKRPDVREQVLNGAIRECTDNIACALRAAAQYGCNDLLKYLITKGNSVNLAVLGDNNKLIHMAAKSQQIETVKILLLLGASIDCQDGSGKTPLHLSVETGNLELLDCLVKHLETVWRGTELQHDNTERTVKRRNILNVPDIDGNTPLHLGVAAGNIDIVSYLVSSGSYLNTCNVQGDYPLTLAARSGKSNIVELLLNSDVESNEAKIGTLRAIIVAGDVEAAALLLGLGFPVDLGENEKPIHVASRLGREEIVRLLLQYGASLTSRTDTGNTALHLASESGHLNLVKYLVEVDRSGLYSLNFENETPLHMAARNGRDGLVNYFAENGYNINFISANSATFLHVACENGHYTTVKCLLKHGAVVNAMNSANQTPLHIAAGQGQTKIVELLFLHNVNFSLRDKDGITALLAASINGHHDTVRFIVQHGGNIEDTDRNVNTIAHFTVQNENVDILNLLSQRNASLDVKNSDGDTPFLKSVREGRNRMVQYLVERNCDMNTQDAEGMWALDIAVLNGNMETTRILLDRYASSVNANMHIFAAARFGFLDLLQRFVAMGDDIKVKAGNGESLLHVACKYGQVATVQYLCEHGDILDLQDNNGNTALHVAAEFGHKNICCILLNGGACVNDEDKNGKTPLTLAAEKGSVEIVRVLLTAKALKDLWTPLVSAASEGHTEVVRVLLDHGASVNIANGTVAKPLSAAPEEGHLGDVTEKLKRGYAVHITYAYGRTLLTAAASNGHVQVVTELLNCGAMVDSTDAYGSTPLRSAAAKGHVEVVKVLLNRGARVDSTDAYGSTPLSVAAAKGHVEVIKELLNRDATVDGTDAYGRTPLIVATSMGHLETVRELLKHKASVDIADIGGRTPLMLAALEGHEEILLELLNHGAKVDSTDGYGSTPPSKEAVNGHVELVTELPNNDVRRDSTGSKGKVTFGSAAPEGFVKTMTEKLNRADRENISDENGRKPLRSAPRKGHVTVATQKLNPNPKADSTDVYDSTHLSAAAADVARGTDQVLEEQVLLSKEQTYQVTGIATESQVLEELRRFPHLPFYIQRCLHRLLRLTQNIDKAREDIIELVLPGMEAHPGVCGTQTVATECLYNLTKCGLVKEIHPSILKKVVELTLTAMENFPTVDQLQKNSLLILNSKRLLQDVEFDKYQCARLVLNCLCTFHDSSMNVISLAICSFLVKKISKCEKSDLGSQPQYLRKLLSIVKSKVQTSCVDNTMKFTLQILMILTDETPTTCDLILEEGGLDLFLKVLVTFQDEQIVVNWVLIVIHNIAEVPQLRPYLILPDFMTKLRKLLHSANKDVSYSAASIIAYMASGGAETCVVDVVPRQKLLQELVDVLNCWKTSGFRLNTGYSTFQSLFPLLTSHEAFEVQLWAVWTIQNLCTINAKWYCPMLIEAGGREKLQQLIDSDEVNPSVRDICLNILDVLAVEQ